MSDPKSNSELESISGANSRAIDGLQGSVSGIESNMDTWSSTFNDWSGKMDLWGGKINSIETTADQLMNQNDSNESEMNALPQGAFEAKINGPQLADASNYDAAKANASTVQDEMSGLLGSDSQYIKRAQDISKMQSNKRGLLNSTMASQAGTAAAIDSALPIAQQDSQTKTQVSLANAEAENQVRQYGAEAANTNDRLRFTEGNNQAMRETELDLDYTKFQEQLAQDRDVLTKQLGADMFSRMSQTIIEGSSKIQFADMTKGEKETAMKEYLSSVYPLLDGSEAVVGEAGMFNDVQDYWATGQM